MKQQTFTVISEYGIHARPATKLVHLAMQFESEVELASKGHQINLKSIMGLMSLGIYQGEIITLTVNGSDEEVAIEKLTEFLLSENLAKRS